MTASVKTAADAQRDRTIESLLENSKVRPSVKHRARRISEACDRLTQQSRPLSVPNVIEAVKALFPDENIASSTVWNKTDSGALYRGVVDAWEVWLLAMGRVKSPRQSTNIEVDIPDSIVTRIEPREVRTMVILMRESLRNAIAQLNGIRSLTADRLIRQGNSDRGNQSKVSTEPLPQADFANIANFIDEHELRLRGFCWGENGELVSEKGAARSGPGLRDALTAALKCLKP
ncbi:hypothetical protein [Paraburkholderia sp. MM5477-R1]|uniref:hypothetical protein n=1 Tax=Paraburkholderia sp. MM5477-R1 TaxID=2991062 RepID=UPI003D23FCB8